MDKLFFLNICLTIYTRWCKNRPFPLSQKVV